VIVMHALDEHAEYERDCHLRYWHGTVRPQDAHGDSDPDHPVVCWCGGRLYRLGPDHAIVWHKRSWRDAVDDMELTEWPDELG
jgi:hypothetical protein